LTDSGLNADNGGICSKEGATMGAFLTAACILGFVVSQTGAYICLRIASQHSGLQFYAIFFLGTTIGFGSPVCMTLALKDSNPNVIYAFCIGGSFFVLQFMSSILFRQTLSIPQWAGIFLVGTGLLLLQMKQKPKIVEDTTSVLQQVDVEPGELP